MKKVEELRKEGYSDEWINGCRIMEEKYKIEFDLSYEGMDGVILIVGSRDNGNSIYCSRDELLCYKEDLDKSGSMLDWCDGEMVVWEEDKEYNFISILEKL